MLMEASYGEDDNIGTFLRRKFCEEFNKYVPDDENVAPQQPCEVVQSPNRICHLVVDVNVTPTFQMEKNLASMRNTLEEIWGLKWAL